MECLVLAAGHAPRLYPLTENFPKPLLKAGDVQFAIDEGCGRAGPPLRHRQPGKV